MSLVIDLEAAKGCLSGEDYDFLHSVVGPVMADGVIDVQMLHQNVPEVTLDKVSLLFSRLMTAGVMHES